MDQQQAKAGKRSKKELDRLTSQVDRSYAMTSSRSVPYKKRRIDRAHTRRGDRSCLYTRGESIDPIVRRATRSIPCMHASSNLSRSIRPAQMHIHLIDFVLTDSIEPWQTGLNRARPGAI
ncbi:unnamed protein product [Microthlaspi erraticum]|uniref:Uncharacterized protein n=1 Tax=Microthlaspi erraticum TaxID=1685480 RepID=A0A6D2IY72_9BRAS|nr:unnamed protein product [Microthlaspi erraticum]